MSIQVDPTRNPTTFSLALAAGGGLTLMIIALAAGVVDPAADGTLIGVSFAAGLLFLILGIVGWLVVVKPFDHFDDINVPKYTGHHDEHHDDEQAIVLHEDAAIIPHE